MAEMDLPVFDTHEERTLLRVARDALLRSAVEPAKPLSIRAYEETTALRQHWATFVTLRMDHALRGCVGGFDPVLPLIESVQKNAFMAAREDPRFPAVCESEIAQIRIHVSILSVIREIESLESFEPGHHGLLLTLGGSRTLFLPEVALEQRWTREETAAALCRKSGAHEDAWREGGQFKVFTTTGTEEDDYAD